MKEEWWWELIVVKEHSLIMFASFSLICLDNDGFVSIFVEQPFFFIFFFFFCSEIINAYLSFYGEILSLTYLFIRPKLQNI